MNRKRFLGAFVALIAGVLMTGCGVSLTRPIDTSSFSKPSPGKAGVYFYSWKTGIIGSYSDVKLIMNDQVLGQINTGEYLYREQSPGKYKYRAVGGILPFYADIELVEGQNHFFRGAIVNFRDSVAWMNTEQELSEAQENIRNGRYKNRDKMQ